MLYLSQLLGATVEDLQGERLGRIVDVLALRSEVGQRDPTFPTALLVEGDEELPWRLPLSSLELRQEEFFLLIPREQLAAIAEGIPGEQEIRLARDVLDKQVIDLVRKKAVRVNDLCFEDDWHILGIDNSPLGLVRRLAPAWLLGSRARGSAAALISWAHIELIDDQPPAENEDEANSETLSIPVEYKTRNPSGHLGDLLYPADIAEIVQQLTPSQGAHVIEGLDDETAADTMEEVDTDRQRQILENLPVERAAAILRAMGPDEIADLLARMPEERAQELLRLMNPQDSEEVQDLLEYEANTAGGLMTTDYIVLNQTRTVAEALEAVRREIQENDVRIAYIYCVNDETSEDCHVLGVVTLWDLLIAAPTQPVQELMEPDVISILPGEPAKAVAEKIAKYNLLAIPVINAAGILEGVITVDDAIDVLLPADRKRKQRRMY
jgi:CBS domain-containing protein